TGEIERMETASPGNRNVTFNKSVFNLARLPGIDRATIESALIPIAKRLGLTDAEIRAKLKSAYNAGLKKPKAIIRRRSNMQTQQKAQTKTTNSSKGANAPGAAQAKQTTSSTTGNGSGGQGAKQSANTGAGSQAQAQTTTQASGAGTYEETPTGLIRWTV